MRRVEERSLSSILRSKLLTTLIQSLYREKLMLAECADVLDKFHAMQTSFRVWIGCRKRPCLSFLSAERCPVTYFRAVSDTAGKRRERKGTVRQERSNICRGRFVEYFGLSAEQTVGSVWQAAKHEERQAAPPSQPRPQPSGLSHGSRNRRRSDVDAQGLPCDRVRMRCECEPAMER